MIIVDNLYEINNNMVDIRIDAKEGFNVAIDNNNFIILNTTLDDMLLKEGFAREVVSKVQNLRKEKNFDVSDRINLYYSSNDYFKEVLKDFEDYIKNETLSVSLIEKDNLEFTYDINDEKVSFDVEKL